jgi:hypothetical protein
MVPDCPQHFQRFLLIAGCSVRQGCNMEWRPYVDLFEAPRVLVRMMPDGDRLAEAMTRRWIDAFMGVRKDYDEEEGREERREERRRAEAYGKALDLLERKILPSAKVRGEGVCDAEPDRGMRSITEPEWSTLELKIRRGMLDTPPGKKFEHFPALRSVQVNATDLTREATARLCPPSWGSNEHKRRAVDDAFDQLGAPRLAAMAQGAREQAVIDCVKDRHNGLTVTDRHVRNALVETEGTARGAPFLNFPTVPCDKCA